MFNIEKKHYIEWHDIDFRCQEFLKAFGYSNTTFDAVIGIARGGMIPATILSYGLNVPLKMLLISSFEDGERKGIKDITDQETINYIKTHKVLIVDDIYDTGQTADYIAEKYPEANFMAVFDKRLEDPDNKYWYVFPWDKDFVEKVDY